MSRALRLGGLLLFGLVLGLAALEGLVRVWLRFAAVPVPRSDRPTFYYAPPEGPVDDRTYATQKPAGVFRIAVVGDSFTYPYDIELDDAYPKRLERILNLSADGIRAEVMNLGRIGADAPAEVAIVSEALEREPDLVLLQITLNDAPANAAQRAATWDMLSFEVIAERHPCLTWMKSVELIARRVHATRSRAVFVAFHRRIFEEPASWARFATALTSMRDLCRAHGVPLAAIIFPLLAPRLDAAYPFVSDHERIGALLHGLGVPVLDLRAAFADLVPERLHTDPWRDSHPNELAHRIAAEQLYLWLEREGRIPPALTVRRAYSLRGLVRIPFVRAPR